MIPDFYDDVPEGVQPSAALTRTHEQTQLKTSRLEPTDKQLKFLESLYRTKPAEDTFERFMAGEPDRKQVSERIDTLLRSANKPLATVKLPAGIIDLRSLSGGRYAAQVDDDVVRFFHIQHGSGSWDGWTFVQLQVGGDLIRVGSQRPGQGYAGKWSRHMNKILADEQAAYQLYGREIGICGVCGRTLTDESSRAIGIGPVCRERL